MAVLPTAARPPFYTTSPPSSSSPICLRSLFLSLPTKPLRFGKQNTNTTTIRRNGSGMVVAMSMEAGIGVMGTKLGMMSYFEPGGTVVPVTVVGFREGNIVTQIKTEGNIVSPQTPCRLGTAGLWV